MDNSRIKRNVLVFVALAVVVSGALYFFFNRGADITNYPSSGHHIIAFGDSLVSGVGASAQSNNFVSRLFARVGEPIINLGVPGNTTAEGFARLSVLDNYNPKVVLLLLGGNDFLRQIPIETTFDNLTKIIEDIHSRGAVVILLGVRGGVLGDRFESEFERLRDEYGTAYVSDVLDGIFGNSIYMYDAVHPNDLGYEHIAERIYPVLLEVMK